MVIAALISFAILLVAWILAPDRERQDGAEAPIEGEALLQAA